MVYAVVIEKTITEDNDEVYDVAVSADDMYLLTASRSGVAVYNSETCEEIVRCDVSWRGVSILWGGQVPTYS